MVRSVQREIESVIGIEMVKILVEDRGIGGGRERGGEEVSLDDPSESSGSLFGGKRKDEIRPVWCRDRVGGRAAAILCSAVLISQPKRCC